MRLRLRWCAKAFEFCVMLKAEEEKGFTRRSGLWWWSRFDGEAEGFGLWVACDGELESERR